MTKDAYGVDYSQSGTFDGACASAGNYNDQGYVIGDMTFGVNK